MCVSLYCCMGVRILPGRDKEKKKKKKDALAHCRGVQVCLYLCFLVLLYMCPRTAIFVPSYYCICVGVLAHCRAGVCVCVLVLLYESPPSYCCMCVLLYVCPRTAYICVRALARCHCRVGAAGTATGTYADVCCCVGSRMLTCANVC